jgi:plastocyanin
MIRLQKRFIGILMALSLLLLLPAMASAVVHQVSIEDFFFTPLNTHASVGDTVRWTNHGAAPHTSTSDQGVWASPTLSSGQSYQFQFTSAGNFPYHCAVHLSMKDTIRVSPTGIDDESTVTPRDFELSQNYPNPFNAKTNIRFTLAMAGHATLEIFDILGQRVAVLVDGDLVAGEHEYTWDAGDRGSGVFFYRLSFDTLTKTARMVLLK